MQFYKSDETELKYYNAGSGLMDALSLSRTDFFLNAYLCFSLGDLIWDSNRSPLAKAIPRNIFREAFPIIFETFLEAGSLEGYITIFKNIFGEDTVVTFTIPAPGKLQIAIEAAGVVQSDMLARAVVGNSYAFDEVIDNEDDNIAFQSIKGMESEYEVTQMLFELVPSGIFTEISLTIGT